MFNPSIPPQIQDFITIFLGIVVEAVPFVILGSLAAGVINFFISEKWIYRLLPRNRFLSHAIMPFLGVIFPVCECGNIPVAKRLFVKGLKSSHVITFILAAPAFNPIVFLSTYTAFRATPEIIFFRFVLTYFIAVGVGILFSYKKNDAELLKPSFLDEIACAPRNVKKSGKIFASNFMDDFGMMLVSLVIGSLIASALQSFTPLDILKTLGQNPILSILTMMIIAFVISICSNVDAFVALSYSTRFTSGSIVAFLVFGPMIDIKSLSMLANIFTKKTLILLILIVSILTFISGLILNFYIF